MKRNFKLILEYDGGAFHGWQRQPEDATVQQALEDALERITGARCVVQGCGRTDAGVHALNYVANFWCETHLEAPVFARALNALLPDGIVVKHSGEAPPDFHARKSAQSKIYEYHIANTPSPPAVGRQYAWFVRRPLDAGAMNLAAALLKGTHDFSALEGAGSPKATSVRTVMQSTILNHGGHLVFRVEANGFLRYMVRNMTGTLVQVGLGKISEQDIIRILESGDRGMAGPTAPPHGLFLTVVKY